MPTQVMPDDVPAILIVESDLATRELYERELGRAYQVFTAGDEHQALTLLRAECIQAVVMEPALLGERGWSLLRAIRESEAERPVHVVLCTALDERRRGLEMGVDAYLVKPVTPANLLSTLDQVLEREQEDEATPPVYSVLS